jgi:hypothetical protein
VSKNGGFVANATSTPADRFIWDSGDPGDDPHRAYRDSVAEFTAASSTPCLDDQPVEVREFGVLAATALALAAPWPNTPDSRGPGAEFDTQVVVPADVGGFRQLLMPPGRSPKWTPPC